MRVKIYVEGGGDINSSKTKCRQGFSEFFRKAGLEGQMPQIVACGGRHKAFDDFCVALKSADSNEFIVLLVDSEGPAGAGDNVWVHLKRSGDWEKPKTATDDNAHLMVQCMESWFLADKDKLEAFFGKEFKRSALPANPETENIEKKDVLDGLGSATRNCSEKGKYRKGMHSFEILAEIEPAKVMKASPHAKRLIDTLIEKAEA